MILVREREHEAWRGFEARIIIHCRVLVSIPWLKLADCKTARFHVGTRFQEKSSITFRIIRNVSNDARTNPVYGFTCSEEIQFPCWEKISKVEVPFRHTHDGSLFEVGKPVNLIFLKMTKRGNVCHRRLRKTKHKPSRGTRVWNCPR